MPEYIMPIHNWRPWAELPKFMQGYVEAALFCGVDLPGDGQDKDYEVAFDDIAPDTLAEMAAHCKAFQRDAGALLSRAYARGYTEEQAGCDFWLTRNGHGAGALGSPPAPRARSRMRPVRGSEAVSAV